MPEKIRVGTRGSRLALWQAHHVVKLLRKHFPDVQFEIEVIKTKGDKILDVALSKIGDKGLFTKEIETALLEGHIEIAVHSMKDLPSIVPEGIEIGAVLARENPQDVLLSHRGYKLADLPPQGRIGTSSLRRVAQLKSIRPDLKVIDLRGNVETRISKMRTENLDGIILAYAGVKRMGFMDEVTDFLSPDVFLPAVGQGAIGVEIRENDAAMSTIVATVHDRWTGAAVAAERAFLQRLEGGCQVPIACLARPEHEGLLAIDGLVASLDGKTVLRSQLQGSPGKATELGKRLAERILEMGAGSILQEIRCMEE
ncbi:MAG: hydroxymethylbilane synthase [Syntrophomonadaceae bacterium]|nr:hydroxymethylbilane synthase [Syntrophomonadaceae bacterium]